jgi:hypothetical protein
MSTSYQDKRWSIATPIAVATGDTDLVAAPGAGLQIVVEKLIVTITTAAAQAFDIEDASGTVEVFKAPASLAAGSYIIEPGHPGKYLTANEKLYFNTAAAGVGLTISGYGRIVG